MSTLALLCALTVDGVWRSFHVYVVSWADRYWPHHFLTR